jgi:amino acid transporter
MLSELPYLTRFQPYMTYFILFIVSLLTLTNGFQVFTKGRWAVSDFLAAYITLPIFLVLYLGHKIWFKTPFYIPVQHIDVMSGKREMDELCKNDISDAPVPKNVLQRIWFWIA